MDVKRLFSQFDPQGSVQSVACAVHGEAGTSTSISRPLDGIWRAVCATAQDANLFALTPLVQVLPSEPRCDTHTQRCRDVIVAALHRSFVIILAKLHSRRRDQCPTGYRTQHLHLRKTARREPCSYLASRISTWPSSSPQGEISLGQGTRSKGGTRLCGLMPKLHAVGTPLPLLNSSATSGPMLTGLTRDQCKPFVCTRPARASSVTPVITRSRWRSPSFSNSLSDSNSDGSSGKLPIAIGSHEA